VRVARVAHDALVCVTPMPLVSSAPCGTLGVLAGLMMRARPLGALVRGAVDRLMANVDGPLALVRGRGSGNAWLRRQQSGGKDSE
jgi:hypothetical protein